MQTTKCQECDKKLTVWNRSTTSPDHCTECMYGNTKQRYLAFFELPSTSLENIAAYPPTATLGKLLLTDLVFMAGAVVGAAFANANPLMGFLYSVMGMLIGFLINRLLIYPGLRNPMDIKRWSTFATWFTIAFIGAWLVMYISLLSALDYASYSGSPATGISSLPFPLAVLLYGLFTAAIGLLAGVACVALAEKKNKADLLRYYQKWKSA
jgi:hypothetical protein